MRREHETGGQATVSNTSRAYLQVKSDRDTQDRAREVKGDLQKAH